MKITFITSNQHKVKEATGIFPKFGITLEHVDLCYPEISGLLSRFLAFFSNLSKYKLLLIG
ncbi:MAG: hypothetical protein ACLQG5_06855 [Methanobacterium sp.]